MMYSNNFVAAIKVNGKILREHANNVYLPFGSEYSILLKNLSNKKALVNIMIDGVEAVSNIIVNANSNVELERFIRKNDNLNVGNKFKFIEKTAEISEYRNDRVEDGIIEIIYSFEASKPMILNEPYYPVYDYNHNRLYRSYPMCGTPQHLNATCQTQTTANTIETMSMNNTMLNESGITVEGSKSNQKICESYIGELESVSNKIVFSLRGNVNETIEVKTKIECKTCGKKNDSKYKFCPNCGTSLIKY